MIFDRIELKPKKGEDKTPRYNANIYNCKIKYGIYYIHAFIFRHIVTQQNIHEAQITEAPRRN